MKRRTFLQLVVMLSSKAIFAPRIAYANDTEEDGYVYLTPDLAVDFASRFAQKLMMMILVQPQTLFWPTAKLAIQ